MPPPITTSSEEDPVLAVLARRLSGAPGRPGGPARTPVGPTPLARRTSDRPGLGVAVVSAVVAIACVGLGLWLAGLAWVALAGAAYAMPRLIT